MSALPIAWENYLNAQRNSRRDAWTRFLQTLKAAVAAEHDGIDNALARAVGPDLSFSAAQSLHRTVRARYRHVLQPEPGTDPRRAPVRIALLGSSTTTQLAWMIELCLWSQGVRASVYESPYGAFRQEILDPESGLHRFEPTAVVLATNWRDLANVPDASASADEVADRTDDETAQWQQLWSLLRERLGCQVIQNNFDPPPWRQLGNHDGRHAAGRQRYVRHVNQRLIETAPDWVTIHDLDELAATHGRWKWADPRFFHHAKIPCGPDCLFDYAHSVSSLIAAIVGRSKKCLALDLDNTLWGGVIGDDGLGGIRLGQGDPEGEAFLGFQKYLKSLQQRGVILTVCSKNEDRVAREVFERHPEMVLRLEDISCFVANWDDKASNLRRTAEALNIGLDALVFVDDNPAERAVVRQFAGEVAVPEMPTDPAEYIRVLDHCRYFQVVSVGREDFQRTSYYRANSARQRDQMAATNMQDYLQSLRMVARVAPIDEFTLARSAQLINKSNQFNLTTRRRSAAELVSLAEDPRWVSRTVSLEDRFGDNGLISVVLAKQLPDALEIDTWLMSCRVLKRGVEDFLLNHLVALAHAHGVHAIHGEYRPTTKNVIVKDHYRDLGFRLVDGDEDGFTRWELPIDSNWQPRTTEIKEQSHDRDTSRAA